MSDAKINELDKRVSLNEQHIGQLAEDVKQVMAAVNDGFSALHDKLNETNLHVNRTPLKDYMYCIVATIAILSSVAGLSNWWLNNTLKPLVNSSIQATDAIRAHAADIRDIRGEMGRLTNDVAESKRFRTKWYEDYQVLAKDQQQTDAIDFLERRVKKLEAQDNE